MRRLFIVFVIQISLSGSISGQERIFHNEDIPKLSAQEKNDFILSIRTLINDLERYITMIADKQEVDQRRKDAIREAIKLFIDPDSNFVEVSSKVRNTTDSVLVRRYFYKLYAIEAAKVEITFYQLARMDSLKRGLDGSYHCTVYIYQMTKIFKDRDDLIDPDYFDKTIKKIEIILEPDNYWLRNETGPKFKTKLGNIRVEQTI